MQNLSHSIWNFSSNL